MTDFKVTGNRKDKFTVHGSQLTEKDAYKKTGNREQGTENRIKIAYFVYPSAFQNKGGGEILLEKIEEYINRTGKVHVVRFDTWTHKLEDFDILHVFGSVKECLPLMQVARSRGVKVVLESIFWSDFRRAIHEEGGWKVKIEKIVRHFIKVICPFFPSARKKMFETADIIIPNSKNEAKQISRLFNINMDKMRVVHNGVDKMFEDCDEGPFRKKYGLEDYVLSVGRIEPRKNQLNLIRAVKGSGKQLVLIGDPVTGYGWYEDKCRKESDDNVYFVDGFEHGSDMLKSAYAGCRVFVLPGWFETPGLAALEAALAGANVVATAGGSTKEYFFDKVLYIDPKDPEDIRSKIEQAYHTRADNGLKDLVLNSYTWEAIAGQMLKIYKEVINI